MATMTKKELEAQVADLQAQLEEARRQLEERKPLQAPVPPLPNRRNQPKMVQVVREGDKLRIGDRLVVAEFRETPKGFSYRVGSVSSAVNEQGIGFLPQHVAERL